MRIHAIQTGTVQIRKPAHSQLWRAMPRTLRTLLGSNWSASMPIYAWVIEHPEGIALVDTGETSKVLRRGYLPWWNPRFRLMKKHIRSEEEIGPGLRALGIQPDDVRWVILTHLHMDHAGGLHCFPGSEIIVSAREYELATGLRGQMRGYLPHRWPAWFDPRLVHYRAEPLGPFPESLPVTRAGDLWLVPTPGHTAGHLSVILRLPQISFFVAGDATHTAGDLLTLSINGAYPNGFTARRTLKRIARYISATPTVYLPSHDPEAARRLDRYEPVAMLIDQVPRPYLACQSAE